VSGVLSCWPHVERHTVRGVFYTPGWGAVLTVTGTLGGVIVTQLANSWITRSTRRKERNDRINDAVSDLIADGGAWIFTANGCEQRAVDAVIQGLALLDMIAAVTEARDALATVQIEFGRALARVRLTCPAPINTAAAEYLKALQAHTDEVLGKLGVLAETRDVKAIQRSVAYRVEAPLNQLVHITREETGG
jgi:hypothetical protein